MIDWWITKAILRALASLQASIDKNTDAVRKQNDAANASSEPQPPRTIQSEVSLQPAIHAYYEAEQRERPSKNRWEVAKRAIEIIGFVAAIAAAIFTYKTLKQIQRQADSAQDQVVVMQKQLVSSERPWLSADISLVKPFAFTDRGGTLTIAGRITNVGHSPALNVRLVAKVIVALGASDLHRRQVEYGDFWKHRPNTGGLPGFTIFPGDQHPDVEGTGMDLDEIKSGLEHTPLHGKITSTLIVCIDYLFSSVDLITANPSDHHQTWYAYPLGVPDLKHPGVWIGFFEPHGEPKGMVLIGSMMGEFAN